MPTKPIELTGFHAHQKEVVRELFINTADENYITARWCFAQTLNVDFFWLALHAIEKYGKAVVLLNGGSALSDKHDISRLYRKLKAIAPGLLPTTLRKPEKLTGIRWREETPEAYLAWLERQGNEHNRYQIYGHTRMSEELFKLDQMVFAIRRLCRVLDAYWLGAEMANAKNLTNRKVLMQQPARWEVSHGILEATLAGKRGEAPRHVFLNCNVPFAPGWYEHQGIPTRLSGRNPVLGRMLRRMEGSGSPSDVTRQLCSWVLGNIFLPKAVRNQLTDALRKPRAKQGAA